MSDNVDVRGNEFIRKVQALAKERGLACRVDEKRGNPKDELKSGTLHAMCKQLAIEKADL